MRKRLHLQRLWAPVFMMAGISVLSGSAGVPVGDWAFAGIDKLAHLGVFGLLAVAWARSLREPASGQRTRLVAAVVLTTLFGLLDEWHQLNNPLRTFEWADLLADFAGSVAGAAAYLWLTRFQAVLELDFRQARRLHSWLKIPNSIR